MTAVLLLLAITGFFAAAAALEKWLTASPVGRLIADQLRLWLPAAEDQEADR